MAKQEKDTGPKIAHKVLSPLHHDREFYDVGDSVDLTERQAARLPRGVVQAPPKEEAPADAKGE